MKQFLEIGKIVGTHGINGEVRVQPWCDDGRFLLKFKTLYYDSEGKRSVKVLGGRVHGNVVLLRLDGVESINTASLLRERVVYMNRNDVKLKKGSYFIQDLIGCKVYDAENGEKCYGEITDVTKTGANDVWHITDETGKEVLIPVIPDVVKSVSVEDERIEIKALGGLFDEN